MTRTLFVALAALAFTLPALAGVKPFASSFRTQEIATDGATLHVRVGGMGPSSDAATGYDKKTQAADLRAVLARPGIEHSAEASMAKPMPVLAIGGASSFGANEAGVMPNAATTATERVVPDAGHWLMEEAPVPTIAAIRAFVDAAN